MADEDEMQHISEVIAMPKVKGRPPITKANARDKALLKAQIEREKRADAQRQRRARAMSVLGNAAEEATIAMNMETWDSKTTEELAEQAVRRMAKVVLFGGDAFAPTTLREASEAANQWANIAYKEAVKKRGIQPESEEDTPAAAAAKAVRQLHRRLQEKKAAGE